MLKGKFMPNFLKDMEKLKKLICDLGITDDVITTLSRLKPFDLAMLKATSSIKVKTLLDSDELKPFWVNKFNKLRLEKDHTFQFRNPDPQSRADFYCGYVLYLAALKEKQKEVSSYYDYLNLSFKTFNCFYAAQEILTFLISACKNDSKRENIDLLYNFLTSQSTPIQEHKTPGCLLLANAYFYLAGFYQSLDLKAESIECYQECWEQLHLAQLLEADSEREIHNAYFNKGLATSNAFGLSSISEIKARCLDLASEALPYPVRNAREANAVKTFENRFKDSMSTAGKDDDDNITRPIIL
ncbi:TPA: Dot/Icm T4SS effector metaeffector MesI [Legionella pneumophila]